MKPTIYVTLQGEIRGPIWWPAMEECYKPFTLRFEHKPDERFPLSGVEFATLRDALLHVSNDGDFQATMLHDVYMTVQRFRPGHTARMRTVRLYGTGENADLIQTD